MEVKSCSITEVMSGMAVKSMVDRQASLLGFFLFGVLLLLLLFWFVVVLS